MAKKQQKKKNKKDPKKVLAQADQKHYINTEKYVAQVGKLMEQAMADLSLLASKVDALPNKPFSFDQNKAVADDVAKTIQTLSDRITAAVEMGSRKEWIAACAKSDEFIGTIMNKSKLTKGTLQSYQDRNLAALAAFTQREVDGMDLSRRVWKYVAPLKDEVEMAVDVTKFFKNGINSGKTQTKMERAIGTGMSAAELSREVRSCLLEPNKLFRRVKDKNGNLQLSKAAKLYHPGRGVYRSSYKNAMRLTRSEINMAYRQSDHLRWQQLDFVVGMKVELSNNHTTKDPHSKGVLPLYDVCDELAGNYPKDFKFVGWHPQCRCHATPILRPLEEIDKGVVDDEGNWHSLPSASEVTDVPQGFKDYMQKNEERIAGWSSEPYYIRDNKQWVDKALHPDKYMVKPLVLTAEEQARLADFEMYGFNHQGSKKFNEALNRAKVSVQKGDRPQFDQAMTDMDAIRTKNEKSTAQKAAKKKEKEIREEITAEKLLAEDLATFTPEQQKNIAEIEKAIKQKKGLKMTYDQANAGKENPNFEFKGEIYEKDENGRIIFEKKGKRLVAKKTKEYEENQQYHVNCQTCTVIHELRRRGFNVEAVGNNRGSVWRVYKKNGVGSASEGYRKGKWLDEKGNPVGYTYTHQWAAKNGEYIKEKSQVEKFFEEYSGGKDGRFEICVDWKGGSAHVFCAERKEGKWFFFDPQSGKKDVFDGYAAKAKLHTFGIVRTDDKLINPKLAETFIPKGVLPIQAIVKQKTREEIIAEIAAKRHAARTPEKVKELQEFAAAHKKKTEEAYAHIKDILQRGASADVEEIKTKDAREIFIGKVGATKMKSGLMANASLERMTKEADKLVPLLKEYDDAMTKAKAIVGDFAGYAGIDASAALKQKSIKGIIAETNKLEQKKEVIIADAIRLKNEFDGVKDLDMKMINETIKNGKLSSISEISDKIKELKKAEETISDLIPNAHELHKSYTISELQEAHKELDGVFSKWLTKYGYSSVDNAPLDHLKNKLDFELSSPTFRYTNKTIIEKAINEKIATINRKIEWNNNVAKLSSLKSFSTKSSKYKDLLAKVESAINSNDLDALKKSIAAAEAEQSSILAKRVKTGGDTKTALNPEYKGGAVGNDISATVDVRTMTSEDPYRGTFTNNIARMQGFDAPAKLVSEAEFDMLEKNCGEVFYRTVNKTTFKGKDMTSKEFASQLYVADKLELNGPGGRVYGDGMYVAVSAWDGRTLRSLTPSLKSHAYNASICYGYGDCTISEMTFTRNPRIIKQTELEKMWRGIGSEMKMKFGNEPNTYACALGYDAMYTTRDYMVIWNRSIIAVKNK